MEAPTLDDRPVSILFGPQCTQTSESIDQIYTSIHQDPTLGFLRDVLENISSLWPSITAAWPALSSLPAKTHLARLEHFFQQGGNFPTFGEPSNVVSTPLAIVSQIIDFWKAKDITQCPTFPESSAKRPPLLDVQGFCIGALTAAAIAFSRNTEEFKTLSSKSVRLAVCIGAAVDLDELHMEPSDRAYSIAVRWKSDIEREQLEQLLECYPSVSDPLI